MCTGFIARVGLSPHASVAKRGDARVECPPALVPDHPSCTKLRGGIRCCRARELYRGATQPVLGEGAKDAEVMMVGEQAGDREDIEGHPFVGPAGRILDQGLEQAGIPREDVYSSNVVKHFRYKLRGKRRIHQKPDRWHVSACLPWLDAELQVVKPERLGPIDIWVNNAMTSVFDFFEDISAAEYERATRVTYLGAIWGTKAVLARMIPRDHGTVVQIGSALAYRGIPLQSPYCGAKHAIKGSFESLRCELRRRCMVSAIEIDESSGRVIGVRYIHDEVEGPEVPEARGAVIRGNREGGRSTRAIVPSP